MEMSDLMLLGILRMPLSDNPKEISSTEWVQIKSTMREAATRIETDAAALEAQAKEIAELKERAEKFEKANDWLIARNRTLEAENQKVLDDWPLASP
jgi:hypothetical protein